MCTTSSWKFEINEKPNQPHNISFGHRMDIHTYIQIQYSCMHWDFSSFVLCLLAFLFLLLLRSPLTTCGFRLIISFAFIRITKRKTPKIRSNVVVFGSFGFPHIAFIRLGWIQTKIRFRMLIYRSGK